MNLSKLKSYAPQARRDFIQAVWDRAAFYGLTEAKIEPIVERGEIAVIAGREHPRSVAEKRRALEERIRRDGFKQTMEALAYTWFNRFVAIRFMELHGYLDHGLRVLSNSTGKTNPEILEKAHLVDLPGLKRDVVIDLKLAGDKEAELYRLLLVAQCNALHQAMPFLFERIGDETELLLPDNLLNTDSLIRKLVAAIDEDDWNEVEIIGWLYQFYISERKAEVFAGLKENQKITPENIPAATQLFTPHWIVRYLVENSLGRLWLLNRPDSRLAEKMPYYIAPVEPETDFIRISSPEEIKVCDPACGSGHMLTYAFDLLCEIYQEAGYAADEIAPKILANNLVGIEIDDRAGALAAFALAMKAAAKMGANRFLRSGVAPDICVLQNVRFTQAEIRGEVAAFVGRDLFTDELQEALGQFEQAKNFGSLIVPKLRDPAEVVRVVQARDFRSDLLLKEVQDRIVAVLRTTEALSPKYHVVVANPPYAGAKGLNAAVQAFLKEFYAETKYDLFSAFIERGGALLKHGGFNAMVTMESWMFLSSFERFRIGLLSEFNIQSLVHMPYSGKGGTSMGINFGTSAFVLEKVANVTLSGTYCCIRYYETDEAGVPLEFPTKNERYATISPKDLKKLPGAPISYWASDAVRASFELSVPLKSIGDTRQGMATSDNGRFLREWFEVSIDRSCLSARNHEEAKLSAKKWFPYNKGGAFRKWYGNSEHFINWGNGGAEVLEYAASLYGSPTRTIKSISEYFKPSISWSKVTTGGFSMRLFNKGYLFDVAGCSIFADSKAKLNTLLGFANSPVAVSMLASTSPTLNFEAGQLAQLPIFEEHFRKDFGATAEQLVNGAKLDWDAYETSWDFTTLPLLSPDHRAETLKATYSGLRAHWQGIADEMKRLEEENNRIFIDAYGLQDELTPDVSVAKITLTCNPAYRYGDQKTEAELEALLLADTMREFLSYAIGCMFGRYSLDHPGLILANQGDGIAEYRARVPKPKFAPNADNVLPLLDRDWVEGDATTRFHAFLRKTFGDERFEENLAFVETAIGKDVRKFLLRDFFADHLKRYKKRPIYWLFSSGPERAFQALVYLHRYDASTLARMRTEYVLPLQGRMAARIDQIEGDKAKATSTSLRKKLQKEQDDLKRQIKELATFEEKLRHVADQRIGLDLDDGVKANYAKFGDLLAESRAIVGAEDDE